MKNKSFLKSLNHALDGIFNSCREERNLRFHIVIANLICVFAYLYGIDSSKWAILFLAIALVISAELFNTAVEKAVDTATKEHNPNAKLSKDAAAGAVLFSAVMSVIIGVCIFDDTAQITYTLKRIFTEAKILIPCLILGISDGLFLLKFKIKQKENDNEEK